MPVQFILDGFCVLLLIFFVLAPVLVKFTSWQSANPNIKVLHKEALPADTIPYFDEMRYAFESLGFTLVAYFFLEEQTPNVTPYVMMLRNQETADLAVAASFLTRTGNKQRSVNYVEFCRKFTDGTELNTNNSGQLNVYRRDPDKMVFSFPSLHSVPKLYDIHRKLVIKEKRLSRPSLPGEGDELRSFHNEFVRVLARQSDFGYLQFDSVTGKYRPTWKGAFLMTWKLLWPIGSIRKFVCRMEAAALVRGLGH